MLKTLAIEELEVGMYVKDIMLKNSDHKVKNQGKVNSKKTIEMLKKQGVTSVVIELEDSDEENIQEQSIEQISVADEFSRSCEVYDEASETVKRLFLTAGSTKPLSAEAVGLLAGEITESVLRNEYAITILTRIRNKSTYQWEHAINCGVLICGFGLYLGFNKDTVTQMTLGALLHDVGSAKVSRGILEKAGKLTQNEMSVVKRHIKWGVELCKKDGFDSPFIIDMTANHHERLDGSGYPRGISGDKISKLARITAIIDVYDAMTGDRPYKKGDNPLNVFRFLLSKKEKFDQSLVQQLIKYLGVHPVGSLIKLSNEKLGVVIQGNRTDPMKPIVKLIFNLKSERNITPTDCDLSNENVTIVSAVKAEDFGINLTKIIREVV